MTGQPLAADALGPGSVPLLADRKLLCVSTQDQSIRGWLKGNAHVLRLGAFSKRAKNVYTQEIIILLSGCLRWALITGKVFVYRFSDLYIRVLRPDLRGRKIPENRLQCRLHPASGC